MLYIADEDIESGFKLIEEWIRQLRWNHQLTGLVIGGRQQRIKMGFEFFAKRGFSAVAKGAVEGVTAEAECEGDKNGQRQQ